jgi:hypothetical protein
MRHRGAAHGSKFASQNPPHENFAPSASAGHSPFCLSQPPSPERQSSGGMCSVHMGPAGPGICRSASCRADGPAGECHRWHLAHGDPATLPPPVLAIFTAVLPRPFRTLAGRWHGRSLWPMGLPRPRCVDRYLDEERLCQPLGRPILAAGHGAPHRAIPPGGRSFQWGKLEQRRGDPKSPGLRLHE